MGSGVGSPFCKGGVREKRGNPNRLKGYCGEGCGTRQATKKGQKKAVQRTRHYKFKITLKGERSASVSGPRLREQLMGKERSARKFQGFGFGGEGGGEKAEKRKESFFIC